MPKLTKDQIAAKIAALQAKLEGAKRHICAATYGEPPDPSAIAALLTALADAASSLSRSYRPPLASQRAHGRSGSGRTTGA